MKLKFFIFGLFFLAGLLFSSPVFAYTYTRTPAGYNSYNPVNLLFSASSYGELTSICGFFNVSQFRLQVIKQIGGQEFYSNWIVYPNLSINWSSIFPFGDYRRVALVCVFGGSSSFVILEYNNGNTIFEVSNPPPPSLVALPDGFATGMLAYAGNTFSSVAPLILIGLGLMIAFWIINKVLVLTNILEKKKSKKINAWDYFTKDKPEKFKKGDWL